jgi:hypothetical protein
MKIQIKHRWTQKIIYEANCDTIKNALEKAVKEDTDLRYAHLSYAHLEGADLGGADLGGADLEGADLGGADLGGAYLGGADLEGADLGGAYLEGAHLEGADLEGADLGGADLSYAHLEGAKNYANNHDFLFELMRRLPRKEIKKSEWEILGQLQLFRPCWNKTVEFPKKPVLRILKKLAKQGFDEYLKKYIQEAGKQ